MLMPFGRHKGAPLEDLPDAYLQWLHGLTDLREPLRARGGWTPSRRSGRAIPRRHRIAAEARPMVEELIAVGYRALARQHHPDHGGLTRAMQLVNAAAA